MGRICLSRYCRYYLCGIESLRTGWSEVPVPVGARFSALGQTGPVAHQLPVQRVPAVKWLGRDVDHPSSSRAVVKEWSYTSTPHWAFTACIRVNCTFTLCDKIHGLPTGTCIAYCLFLFCKFQYNLLMYTKYQKCLNLQHAYLVTLRFHGSSEGL